MQGSFWKSIAVVGVIGIGSLAILEVQRSITEGAAADAQADEDAAVLAQQIVPSGERTVDATLQPSEFEKLLTGTADDAPQFDLTEPPESPDEGAFYGDTAAHQQNAEVDTTVAAENLADGNPFAREEARAVAAGYTEDGTQTGGVQPVGFEAAADASSDASAAAQNPEPADFTAEQPPIAFAPDAATIDGTDANTTAGGNAQRAPDFPLFGQEKSSPADGAAATNGGAMTAARGNAGSAADDQTPTAEDASGTLFFGADGDPTAASGAAANSAQPERTVQAAGPQPPPLQPTPESNPPAPFAEDSAIPGPTLAPETSAPSGAADGNSSVPNFDEQFGTPFPSSEGPTTTAPGETAPNRSAPADNRGGADFPSFEDGNGSLGSSPNPQTQPQPDPQPFPLSDPDRGSNGSEEGPATAPFSEDLVPAPREPGQTIRNSNEAERGNSMPEPPAGRPSPTPSPSSDGGPSRLRREQDRRQPNPLSDPFSEQAGPTDGTEDASTLPFVEDMAPGAAAPGFDDNSGGQDLPSEFPSNEPPALSIPGSENRQPRPAPEPDTGFTLPPREDSGTGSRFEDLPDDFPGADGFPDENNSRSDRRDPFSTEPEVRPRDIGNRNFDPQDDLTYPEVRPRRRPMRDGAVRTVAGQMRPNLVLQKSAPENATVGTPIQYSILLKNEGDATAYDVVVEDEVTAAARVNGVHPQSEIDRRTNKLVWRFAQIAPGEDQNITVEVVPTGEGTMDGVASVRFKTRVKASTVVTAPKLEIQMRGPDEVRLGDEVRYSYVIMNRGSGEARDVYVRTVLPESGGLRHPAGNDLEYKIDSLKPNEQREISLAVIAGEPGEYRAEAEVTAAGGAKSQASWRTKIAGAQLKIVRRGPRKRFVNREGTYENIISNESNFDARDARVVEEIPAGMKFIDATRGGRYDDQTRTVSWNINRIGPNQVETLQVRLMPTAAGSAESTVTIYENVGLQSSEVSTTVVEDLHNVSADISQLDGPVALGEVFGFTIAVDNRGTADATDVSLTVEVPTAIKVVGAGSREVEARLLEGNVVQYNVVVRIPPNQQKDFELKLKGVQEVQNALVKASVRYTQMEKPLVVSESVTVYQSL